jgi:hypothetical protein
MAHEMGLKGGWSLDITASDERGIPWGFSKPEIRDKARKLLRETKPTLLAGSPMCREWGVLQNLNKEERMTEARAHLAFVIELYNLQLDEGRYWLHERPKTARSWKEKNMVELLTREDIILLKGACAGSE